MPAKRKRQASPKPSPSLSLAVITKKKECAGATQTAVDAAFNAFRFRSFLRSNEIGRATEYAEEKKLFESGLVFMGSDRREITHLVASAAQFKDNGNATEETLRLLGLLAGIGMFSDSRIRNLLAVMLATRGQIYSYEVEGQEHGFDLITEGDDNAICRMISELNPDKTDLDIAQIIPRASDRFLNTPVRCGHVYTTPVKAAVVYGFPRTLEAMLRRLPGVNLDLVLLTSPLAEPLQGICAHSSGSEIDDLVRTGEYTMGVYYESLASVTRTVLDAPLVSELISIVCSYLTRMPLSNTPLLRTS